MACDDAAPPARLFGEKVIPHFGTPQDPLRDSLILFSD
jgi:hypothetical protein